MVKVIEGLLNNPKEVANEDMEYGDLLTDQPGP